MEKDELALDETYQELMCHYYICLDLHPSRGNVISLKPWVEYLFPVMDGPIGNIQVPVSERKIAKTMRTENHKDVILEEDDGEYERGNVFLSLPIRIQDRSHRKRYWLAICQLG